MLFIFERSDACRCKTGKTKWLNAKKKKKKHLEDLHFRVKAQKRKSLVQMNVYKTIVEHNNISCEI